MTLSDFLRARKMTQTEFEELSGVRQCQISAYVRRARKPSRETALAIERATRGVVSVRSWDQDEKTEPALERSKKRRAA